VTAPVTTPVSPPGDAGLEEEVVLGVAVPVPDPWGATIQSYRVALGDPDAAGIPTHITLLPPTALPRAALGAVAEHLDAVAAGTAPFRVHLRGTGSFRPVSPVVFLAVVDGIGPLEQLEEAVRSGPLTRPLQFPYHPHVTLAHDLPGDQLDRAFEEHAAANLLFEVARFACYQQHDGIWTPVAEHRLGG
jgi:2'-5' RNA ligase